MLDAVTEGQVVGVLGGALGCGILLLVALGLDRSRRAWILPAALSAGFLVLSLRAAVLEGPTGFWPEHTRNLWGNQIWLDLILAASMGLTLSAAEARRLGMRLPVWIVLVLATGSIGLCAYAARMLYLRSRAAGA